MKIKLLKSFPIMMIICLLLSSCEETQVPLTGINLTDTSLVIEVDSVAALIANIEPLDASNKTLQWSSSDETVATVSSEGIIMGISPGTATIIVESDNGYSETCNVNIVKIITFNPKEEIDLGSGPCIAIDNNNLWYGGLGGLQKMGFDGTGWVYYPLNSVVHDIDFDSNNNLWAATSKKGLIKFDGETWFYFDTGNSEIPTNSIESVAVDHNDNIWIGLSNIGVAKFDGSSWQTYTTEDGLVHNFIWRITEDLQNNIWFASWKGVSMFDGVLWKSFLHDEGLAYPNILDIAVDEGNNVWLTSMQYGVFKYDGSNLINYNTSNSSIPINRIPSMAIDNKGNKWLGCGFVSKSIGEGWVTLDANKFNIDDIRKIVVDSEGNKWFASTEKIYKLIGLDDEP